MQVNLSLSPGYRLKISRASRMSDLAARVIRGLQTLTVCWYTEDHGVTTIGCRKFTGATPITVRETEMISGIPPTAWTFIAAELLLLLTRSRDIIALAKNKRQRTKIEQHEVNRGLGRALLLEAFIFVPTSSLLLILISPLALPASFFANPQTAVATSSLLGIASYGFPFATVKRLITRLALATLREFAELLPTEAQTEIPKEPPG